MEGLNCASCGLPLTDGEPHCSQCKESMTCNVADCSCACGNGVLLEDVKCDQCLEA